MQKTVFFAALLGALPALAADSPSVDFSHHDWELVCDNTRTCRAAGYHAEGAGALPVSVLLERKAGPGTPVTGELQLGILEDAEAGPARLEMRIDGKPLGQVALDRAGSIGALAPRQVAALLAAVGGSGQVEWRAGKRVWRLSGKGAAAVLLKMDEFQGRLGTRGAALRKGGKDEAGVLPPLPAPVVLAAKVPALTPPVLNAADRRELLAVLRKGAGEDCADLEAVAKGEEQLQVEALSRDRMLVSARCWRGAYNEGHGYWVANLRAPFAPALVTYDGTDHEAGTISAGHRGRGIGDCYGSEEWVWDGRVFVHTSKSRSGMCREIAAGGAWDLPTLVSVVKR